MAQNVGQSRGSQVHKQFVQDSANSYIVEAFKDMSETAPVAPIDGQGYIVSNVGSIHGSWGTITGLADNDIIRWRQSKLAWQITMKAVVANQGFKAFVKEEDTLYVVDSGAEWIVASGSGGGVKNFAQKQASAYKVNDWIKGNSGIFGASGALDGAFEIETAAPLDGKKSFKYTTDASSGDDWFYLLVDIDQYARGGVLAFVFDYQWDGNKDIKVQIWDPTFTNQYSTELNILKNTENDNKLARNSRTIFALPDTESQVVVGFQIDTDEVTGKTLIWDNIKVTDDIGVIGSGVDDFDFYTSLRLSAPQTWPNTNAIVVNFNQVAEDRTGAFDGVNGVIIPEDGDYLVTVNLYGYLFTDTAVLDAHIIQNLDIIRAAQTRTSSNIETVAVSDIVSLKAGDVIRGGFRNQSNATGELVANYDFTFLTVAKIRSAQTSRQRFLQVPNGEKLRDTFSASIDSAGNISRTNGNWIDSINNTGAGKYTINFVPGFFSEPPNIQVAVDDQGAPDNTGWSIAYNSVTTSGCLVEITIHQGTTANFPGLNRAFTIYAQRTGNDIAPDIIGVPVSIQGQTHEEDSIIRMDGLLGATGQGTVNTEVFRFANLHDNRGSAITYVDSVTEGSKFIINESGLYHCMMATYVLGNQVFSITRNSTNHLSGTSNCIVAYEINAGSDNDNIESASGFAWLNKGDVVRACGSAGTYQNTNWQKFTIAKVGTQPLLDGGVVKQPDTFFRVDATGVVSSYVSGTGVVQFSSTPVEYRGNGVEWDAATSSYKILKDGVYSFSTSVQFDSVSGFCGISLFKNTMAAFGDFSANSNVKLTETYLQASGASNPTLHTSWSGYLFAGEYVNVVSASNISLHAQVARSQFSVASVGEIEQYTSRVYKHDPIAWQMKKLAVTVSSTNSIAQVVSGLSFNNLEAGKTYRVSGWAHVNRATNTSGSSATLLIDSSGAVGAGNGVTIAYNRADSYSGELRTGHGINHVFTAVADGPLTIKIGGAANGVAAEVVAGSYLILEELPFHAATSKWT